MELKSIYRHFVECYFIVGNEKSKKNEQWKLHLMFKSTRFSVDVDQR